MISCRADLFRALTLQDVPPGSQFIVQFSHPKDSDGYVYRLFETKNKKGQNTRLDNEINIAIYKKLMTHLMHGNFSLTAEHGNQPFTDMTKQQLIDYMLQLKGSTQSYADLSGDIEITYDLRSFL